jgi:hypothetical protein
MVKRGKVSRDIIDKRPPNRRQRSGAINRRNPVDCPFIIYKQKHQDINDLNLYG